MTQCHLLIEQDLTQVPGGFNYGAIFLVSQHEPQKHGAQS